MPIKTVIDEQHLDYPTIKKAEEQGWITRDEIEEYRLPRLSSPVAATEALTLNPEQEVACKGGQASLNKAENHTFFAGKDF